MLSMHPGEQCVSALLLLLCGLIRTHLAKMLDDTDCDQFHNHRTSFVFSVSLSFWTIPPTASYTAKSARADPKNGPERKEFQSQNYLQRLIYQTIQTMLIRAENIYFI